VIPGVSIPESPVVPEGGTFNPERTVAPEDVTIEREETEGEGEGERATGEGRGAVRKV
jgi:hypothetical protein